MNKLLRQHYDTFKLTCWTKAKMKSCSVYHTQCFIQRSKLFDMNSLQDCSCRTMSVTVFINKNSRSSKASEVVIANWFLKKKYYINWPPSRLKLRFNVFLDRRSHFVGHDLFFFLWTHWCTGIISRILEQAKLRSDLVVLWPLKKA